MAVVEDLEGHWEDVEKHLREAMQLVAPMRISTEKAFREYLDRLMPADAPDLFIVDMMLRWTDPAPNLAEPPDDVQRGGFVQAGLRCVERILQNPVTAKTPIIINTVLDEEDIAGLMQEPTSPLTYLPSHVRMTLKGDNGNRLIAFARRFLEP